MPEMNNRELLVQVFRVAVASAAGKIDEAVEAFRRFVYTEKGVDDNISVISGTPDDYTELPSLVPVTQPPEFWHQFMKSSMAAAPPAPAEDDNEMPPLISLATLSAVSAGAQQTQHIDLVISETEQEPAQIPQRTPSVSSSVGENEVGDEEEEADDEAEEEEVDEEEEAEEEEAEEEEAEEAEATDAEEEAEEEAEAEEVELNLEPVRIKKVIYWKDTDSGDLYAYLPDDEVGDKVGSYVDGKPVFD
jgi:flagellar biosynthesis GTPase FlhF